MPQVTCQQCSHSFWRNEDEAWKRICLSCWKKNKQKQAQQQQAGPDPFAGIGLRPSPPKTLVIEPEMMRRLLHLCHPDKHNNSEAAQKATQWLLKIRG